MGKWRYSSIILNLDTRLDGSGQPHAPAALPAGDRWTGGWESPIDGLDSMEREQAPSLVGNRTPFVQPVA
jgi:hypothetical protein